MPIAFNPATLRRPLLSPEASTIQSLQADLIQATTRRMPTTKEHAIFIRPGNAVVSILGRNAIERALRTAAPNTQLGRLRRSQIDDPITQITDHIIQKLTRLPSAKQEVAAVASCSRLIGGRPEKRALVTPLHVSSISREGFIASTALQVMGGIPIARKQREQEIEWVRFGMALPKALEDELVAIANSHIPPDTQMTFGPVTADSVEIASLYYNLDSPSSDIVAP